MNENYRHRRLLQLLLEKKALSTTEIVDQLEISPATARRDINKLAQQGRLKKVRNGAESIQSFPADYQYSPVIHNIDEKQRIAQAASQLCQDGDSIILTCGSTMKMLGEHLCGRKLQIITNFIPLANKLIENNHEDIVIMGGQYNRNKAITLSLNQGESPYAANIMFTSGKGFTTEGLYKTDMIIANSEQRLSAKAGKYVVLLDSTKLGQQVGMLFTKLQDIDLLITGKHAEPELIQALKEKGLSVMLV
ncbi:HTH-type transcriptional regulator UlaR [Rodentibacter trehalosifermentans]|uniref:Transcriptional regulator n=1 Tax=Rodentibacter trehalosifermentans TaxID=1908263 RepID=A0A1V3IWX3_9PAST|nr:HTH-type transcriptional regulator UlaR [Rodentibacter trehalosifermentans]OOF46603.1 transcriptional regulator [Rodentibacter trehalosifermentans]OOF48217.1 transcriptional regulator [Rodentibacter trehalosifermentans]OOF50158.1 transcriptional regulator [Rodentibacter trehalosifermentans]